MAIGFLSSGRILQPAGLIALVLLLVSAHSQADDQIKKKNGSVLTGQIVSVTDGQVMIQGRSASGGVVKQPVYLTDIDSIIMEPPADVTKVKGAAPAAVIAALAPIVQQYAGLPVDWLLDAMSQLGEAYDAAGQADQASAIYAQINQLYPNSPYQMQAITGKARQSLKAGKVADALAAIQPVVTEANQNLAPSPAKGRLYANAFLVYGQVLEAEKKYPEALEAYLTVKTMFYQNPALVEQAGQLVKNLRAQNPGLGVD